MHHEERSFFRAEKALPIAFIQPRRGSGMLTQEAKDKLSSVATLLNAAMVEGPEELRTYTEEEANRW